MKNDIKLNSTIPSAYLNIRGSAVLVAFLDSNFEDLPAGADAVVPVEATTPLDEAGAAIGDRGRDATGPLPAWCIRGRR